MPDDCGGADEIIIEIKVKVLVTQSCLTLQPHGLSPIRLLCPWDFPGKNTGVGCHFLLLGIFLTQGSNPSLLHCRRILYRLRHQGTEHNTIMLFKSHTQKQALLHREAGREG